MTAAPVLAPRERPILFSAPMVLAILDGRKTVTRRLSSRYQVGDLLWVKETWGQADSCHEEWGYHRGKADPCLPVLYRATDPTGGEDDEYWRPSIHMPKWASRIWLEVTAIRKERLQDITPESAIAEGLACLTKDGGTTYKYGIPDRDGMWGTDDYGWPWRDWHADPRVAFARLWNRIHGPGAWASNPEVYAITFRRVK